MKIISSKKYSALLTNINARDEMIQELKLDLDYQKDQTSLAELQVKQFLERIKELEKENEELKTSKCSLSIELEDTKGFLNQERKCSNALRKERTKLRGRITVLSKKLEEFKNGRKNK